MAGPIILSGSTLAAGIRDDFDITYRPTFDGVIDSLKDAMQIDVPQTVRTQPFGMHETMPYPELWNEGEEGIPTEGTGSKSFNVTAYTYAKRVQWLKKDREDNQVGDLRGKAQALGQHFASLDSRIFFELLTNSASLLPAIPNAPDGAALYSTTDGASAARFGVSSGNLLTGTGVASSATIETDFFTAIEQMGQFQDTKGQPYWNPAVDQERYVVYFGIGNLQKFTQAFKGVLIHSVQATTGAGVSNVVLASGVQVTLRPTSRITDNDWFVFRADSALKPTFSTLRIPLTAAEATEGNSDAARNTGVEYVQWRVRKGYGVNVPFGTVKVNN